MRCKPGGEVPTFVDGHGGHPERDVEGAVPYGGIGQFSPVFNHPEGIQSCARAQFMPKAIHGKANSCPSGQFIGHRPSCRPGRVPFEHLKQSTFPRWQSLRLRPEAKPPPFAQGRHGCAANPEGKGTMGLVKEMENEKYPSGGKSGGGYGINETNGKRKILPPGESPEGVYF